MTLVIVLLILIAIAFSVLLFIVASFGPPVVRIQSKANELDTDSLNALARIDPAQIRALEQKIQQVDFNAMINNLNIIQSQLSSVSDAESFVAKLNAVANFCQDKKQCTDTYFGRQCITINPCNI